jgi:Zn-dependent protease with chaperone function
MNTPLRPAPLPCPGTTRLAALAAAITVLCAPAAQAQGLELPFKLPSFLQGASAPASAPAATAAPRGALDRAATAAAAAAAPVTASSKALGDLKPDADCSRPQEGFDVMAKVVEYGGENARLRLERLLATDFKYDDLTPQDRAMLKYIAYTTIWVPPTLESKLGGIYSSFNTDKADESFSPSARRAQERIALLRQQVSDFPGEIELLVLRSADNGASAQAGGLITIAQGFVSDLEGQPSARDLILAHEMSHVYKRHALKEIQFQLVSSAAGFSIAKKLLGRALPGASSNVFSETFGMLQLGTELVSFVRGLQVRFNQDQELEADACAAVWMKRASMDTTDAWKAFETVSASAAGAGTYFDTHPSSAQRKARFVAATNRPATPPGARKPNPAAASTTPTTPAKPVPPGQKPAAR